MFLGFFQANILMIKRQEQMYLIKNLQNKFELCNFDHKCREGERIK